MPNIRKHESKPLFENIKNKHTFVHSFNKYLMGICHMQRDLPDDSVVRNPLEMEELQETLVWSQGIPEDILEEKMATPSHILVWKIP